MEGTRSVGLKAKVRTRGQVGTIVQSDDEIMFGRALDESRACAERIEAFRSRSSAGSTAGSQCLTAGTLALDIAAFELHGATLRSLARWYPDEPRVGLAVAEWVDREREVAGAGATG
jgi:hypothetical protein